MFISYDSKVIFIHIQRTGGTTITSLLKEKSQNYKIVSEQHTNVKSLDNDFFDSFKTHQIFTFVRNPWARLFSWYNLFHRWDEPDNKDKKVKFEAFLLGNYLTTYPTFHFNQLDYITNNKGEIITNYIGRFENFELDVNRIFQSLKIPLKGKIPIINQSKNNDYRQYYTEKSRNFVTQKCQRDIEYFNYVF